MQSLSQSSVKLNYYCNIMSHRVRLIALCIVCTLINLQSEKLKNWKFKFILHRIASCFFQPRKCNSMLQVKWRCQKNYKICLGKQWAMTREYYEFLYHYRDIIIILEIATVYVFHLLKEKRKILQESNIFQNPLHVL